MHAKKLSPVKLITTLRPYHHQLTIHGRESRRGGFLGVEHPANHRRIDDLYGFRRRAVLRPQAVPRSQTLFLMSSVLITFDLRGQILRWKTCAAKAGDRPEGAHATRALSAAQ